MKFWNFDLHFQMQTLCPCDCDLCVGRDREVSVRDFHSLSPLTSVNFVNSLPTLNMFCAALQH